MKAIILAGGFGTRLHPLSCNIPKPMVLIVNKPILVHIIERLKQFGISEIIMLLYYRPEIIKEYFEKNDFGINITYLEASEDWGTAGSARIVKDYIHNTFLVINGDILSQFDFKNAIEFHKEKGGWGTILLTKVENPLRYGVVITESSGRIMRFVEKPRWNQVFSDTVNTGIYILEPQIFDYIPSDEEFSFSTNLFPLLLKKNVPLYAWQGKGYWRDVGNLAEYRTANIDFLKQLSKNASDGIIIGKNVEIHRSADLQAPLLIGDNTYIGAECFLSGSIIGDNCTIDDKCEIHNSILWNGVRTKKRVQIDESIISKWVNIDEKAHLSSGVVISEECSIGYNSRIKNNVKVWPHKIIEPSAIISSNLIWGEKWSRSIFSPYGVIGQINVEVTPEFCSKLGVAYGSTLPKDAQVLLSCDAHKTSQMLKQALISGLLSAGISILDLNVNTLPVSRYKLKTFGEVGGVHIQHSPYEATEIDIKFMGERGLDLSSEEENSIERTFFREDFRRVHCNEIGKVHYNPRVRDYYKEGFLRYVDTKLIQRANYKIVIDYSFGTSVNIFPDILSMLGCEIISLDAYTDTARLPRFYQRLPNALKQLAEIVSTLKADMGFVLDISGEKVFIIDEKGNILNGDISLAVFVLLILRHYKSMNKSITIAVPITASHLIEQLAEEYNGKVLRIPANIRSMMEAATRKNIDFVGGPKGGFIFPHFQIGQDGMISIVKLMELLKQEELSLNQLVELIPPMAMVRKHLSCPWELKASVMRRLTIDIAGKYVNFIDGVKIFHNEAWVLIKPDANKSLFHINAEADTLEKANELAEHYINKLKTYQELGR